MSRSFLRAIYKVTHPVFRFINRNFLPKINGSRAILLRENKILLVKNIGLNYWSFPGGGIKNGESPEDGLFREVEEELNIKIKKVEYRLGEYDYKGKVKRDKVYIFVANSPTFNIKKQWEIDEAQWFDLNNLPQNLSPATGRRIKEYLEGKKGVKAPW